MEKKTMPIVRKLDWYRMIGFVGVFGGWIGFKSEFNKFDVNVGKKLGFVLIVDIPAVFIWNVSLVSMIGTS